VTKFLRLEQVIAFHDAIPDKEDGIRDVGIIASACGRPQATAFGEDAYSTVWEKAAAFMQSLARNHGFVDANKRTAWISVTAFLDQNGHPLDPDFDKLTAYALVQAVATGHIADVALIANELVKFAIR
jgi:death-on-curing protein